MTNNPKPFAPNARVSFREGMRPAASTLPEVMVVFISTARETVVLVDGSPQRIYTGALQKA